MNSDKINIADLQQLNVSTLTTIRDAFNSAESLDMAEFVEVLKLAHEKEFQKLKDAIGANDLINADQIQDKKRRTSFKTHQTLHRVFQKIDANGDGNLDWDEFTNYLLLEEQGAVNLREALEKTEIALQDFPEPSMNAGRYHRESINAILKLTKEQEYLTCSGDGVLRVWRENDLHFQRATRVGIRVTHAVLLTRSKKIAVSAIDRSIRFFDALTLERSGAILHLPSVVTTLGYYHSEQKEKHNIEMLFAGDDQGFLNTFTLSVNEFWHVGTVESYIDLADFPNLTHGVKYDGEWIHDEWITQIKFYEDLDDLVTSSMDGSVAFVDLDRNRQIWNYGNKNGILTNFDDEFNNTFANEKNKKNIKPKSSRIVRRFTVHSKAVHTFIYCPLAKCIASSGLSRDILVWNAHSMGILAKLSGHMAPVTALVLHENQDNTTKDRNQLVSLSTDKVFKVWDLRTYQNLQTIIDNSLYRPENRISSFFFDIKNRRYDAPCLVTGTNRLTLWPIVKTSTDSVGTTHSAPIAGAMYNKTFDQVITGALDGSIDVWDYSTGNIVFKFDKAHNMAKMTCMCLDFNQRRLVTGADDGSCKIWNFSNGQCLQRFGGSQSPQELTSVVFACEHPKRSAAAEESSTFGFSKVGNNNGNNDSDSSSNDKNTDDSMKYILTAGWERRVFVYKEGSSDTVLQPFSHCMPPLSYIEKQNISNAGGKARKMYKMRPRARQVRPRSAHVQRRFGNNARLKNHPLMMKRAINAGPRPVSAAPMRRREKNIKAEKSYSTTAHMDDITCICHCPPRMVASGGADGYVILWSLESGHRKWKQKAIDSHHHHHQVFDKLSRGNKSKSKKSMPGSVEVLVYHEKLSTLISTGTDSQIRFWNVYVGNMLAVIDGDQSSTITSMILPTPNPLNNTYMFAGDSSGQIIIWHGDIDSVPALHERNVNVAKNSSDNSNIIHQSFIPQRPGTSLGGVTAHDNTQFKQPVRPSSAGIGMHHARPFSAKGRIQANTAYKSQHRHITGETLAKKIKIISKWSAHDEEITSITYCSMRKHLITGSRDTSVSVWTLLGDHIGTFGQRNGFFKRGGKYIAWDIDNRKTWKNVITKYDAKVEKEDEFEGNGDEKIEDDNDLTKVESPTGDEILLKEDMFDNNVGAPKLPSIEEKDDMNSDKDYKNVSNKFVPIQISKEDELRRERQLEEDLYKLKKINHYKRIYGTHHKISAEDQLFNMKQRYMSKRKDNFKGGWHGRAGKNNSDIWMQLHVPRVVDIPQNLGRFIHRPIREERLGIGTSRRKKNSAVRVKKKRGGYY
jgi:WD40 repeat protein